ncbi:hypothetical protein CcCBS67573_g08095 [Chytriomyces confervae]|uniref:Uncharacterized protein n=1 Tax=Chytriomyces confervae TaxID=246404 RepID=A0A507EQH4_9FUNG|nr:hypothetical protein CcCBS67573_g08095 [Chytriomyces confervae]
MHFEGYGVPVNHAKGIEHYFLGMDAGSINCINQVGALYSDGTGVEKDVKKAVELLEKAVSLGNGIGCCYLGDLYQAGDDGIPKDPSKAVTYFEQAVQLEYDASTAKRCLAYLYDKGIGVEQNYHNYRKLRKIRRIIVIIPLGCQALERSRRREISLQRGPKQNNAAAMSNLGHLSTCVV